LSLVEFAAKRPRRIEENKKCQGGNAFMKIKLRNTSVYSLLLASASFYHPGAAAAQDAASVETVVVTGSLISRPGFQAPTPVTAIGADDLTKAAQNTIADALNQLPEFGTATKPVSNFQGGGNAGANYINLRNFGTIRTLVLLDGERVVASALTNSVDLNTLPSALIQRVDVVTGGASATYGSDAVAGVVNLILDKNFEGVKGSAQYGNDSWGVYETYKADIAAGTSFDGGRGHIEGSFEYSDSPNMVHNDAAHWTNYTLLMKNPAYTPTNGQPKLIHAKNVGTYQATDGGVITAGPLKNTQFIGPDATPVAFNPGFTSGILSFGGDASLENAKAGILAEPTRTYNLFLYGSYKLTPNITSHIELDHGYDAGITRIPESLHNANVTIRNDNPNCVCENMRTAFGRPLSPISSGVVTCFSTSSAAYPG